MQRGLILLRSASLAVHATGVFGLARIKWIQGQVMYGEQEIDPFFIEMGCVLLFTIGLFASIGLFWNWISEWRWVKAILTSKAAVFHSLYDEIVETRDNLVAVIDGDMAPRSSLHYGAKLWELSVSLNRLRIDCPDRPPSFERSSESVELLVLWYTFLVSLAAQSRVYALRDARMTLKVVLQRAKQPGGADGKQSRNPLP